VRELQRIVLGLAFESWDDRDCGIGAKKSGQAQAGYIGVCEGDEAGQ